MKIPERVAKMEIRHEIRIEFRFLTASIVHVLLSDITALERGISSAIVEIKRIIKDNVGRKGYWRVAERERNRICPLILINVFHKILYAVARKGEITSPVKPYARLESSL